MRGVERVEHVTVRYVVIGDRDVVDRVEDARTHLKEDDTVSVMIINVDRKNRTINLSVKAKDMADETEAMAKLQSESAASSGSTNLGALLKAKLDNKNAQQ